MGQTGQFSAPRDVGGDFGHVGAGLDWNVPDGLTASLACPDVAVSCELGHGWVGEPWLSFVTPPPTGASHSFMAGF